MFGCFAGWLVFWVGCFGSWCSCCFSCFVVLVFRRFGGVFCFCVAWCFLLLDCLIVFYYLCCFVDICDLCAVPAGCCFVWFAVRRLMFGVWSPLILD